MLPESQKNYVNILSGLKQKIAQARLKVAFAVNSQMLVVYWEIGRTIWEQQKNEGWGTKIIDRLAVDLKIEFPEETGFSVRNLKYMRAFAEAYPEFVQQAAAQIDNTSTNLIVQQLAAQLPWTHHMLLLDKVKDTRERTFYIQKSIENGWSRAILTAQINSNLYERQGKAISNFSLTLPKEQSDLAQQSLKNPFILGFLGLTEDVKERELEQGLIKHLKSFMLELGKGFAFVGNQKNIVVGDDDFFMDLLFYNYLLHCFVVFELKVNDFKPEYAGKLNFYVNAIDEQLKGNDDHPTIGVLLCKTPNETLIKYSLKNIESPIGVADYELEQSLPKQLKRGMPSIEELQDEIEKEYEELKPPGQKRFEALKERLAQMKPDGEVVLFSIERMYELIDRSLVPFFKAIIVKMQDFKDWFDFIAYHISGHKDSVFEINELAENWKNEEFLNNRNEFHFIYSLRGFKKAGADASDLHYEIRIRKNDYRYWIELLNSNEPVVKKTFSQQLTDDDICKTVDLLYNKVMDDIDRRIEDLNKQIMA